MFHPFRRMHLPPAAPPPGEGVRSDMARGRPKHHLKSGDRPSLFQELVPRITEAYIISRMQMAEAFLLGAARAVRGEGVVRPHGAGVGGFWNPGWGPDSEGDGGGPQG